MRIKEFSVFRYGPLPIRDKIKLGNFTLLFGYNEEGKTLTIDALVKMLLGKSSRGFERINRVEEQPEGYLILEKEGEEDLKLPEKGNLTGVTGLTVSECRNIFIIRDSDLSISREEDFYKDVTNRLVGLQTEEIAQIITELRHLGSLTLKGDFQDTAPRKLKSRLNVASGLIDEIDEKIKRLDEVNYEKIEEELWDTETGLENIEEELDLYEDARKRNKYQRGKEALGRLQDSFNVLKDLSAFNREEELQWQQHETNLITYENEKNNYTDSLDDEEKKLLRFDKSIETEQFVINGLTRDKNQVEERLKPKIVEYKSKEQQIKKRKSRSTGRFLTFAGPLAILAFILSLLSIFLWEEGQWADVSALASLVIMVLYGGFLFSLRSEEKRLSTLLRKIMNTAHKLKIKAENPEEILEKTNEFNKSCDEREKKIQELEKNIAVSNQRIDTIKENLSNLEKKVREAKDVIEYIRARTGVESLQDYRDKLKKREENEQLYKTQQGVLASQFSATVSPGGDSPAGDVSFWEEKVSAFAEYAGKAKGIEYNDGIIRQIKQKRDDLRNRKQELGYQLENYKKEIEVVEREVNDCLAMENEHIPCQTVKDLYVAKEKLLEFIGFYEKNSEYAREAINIYEEIGAEEEKKIQDLFGRESSISKYFAEITGNHYTEVVFNQEKGAVEVLRSDGALLEAWKLSGGAYDQLYLSIRISLGEELLKGEKGFFILDDPFLKSDTRRLKSQLEVLRKISDDGWQIIFFTAKDEVKEALQDEVERGEVNLVVI